jgi:hypothetical protein
VIVVSCCGEARVLVNGLEAEVVAQSLSSNFADSSRRAPNARAIAPPHIATAA